MENVRIILCGVLLASAMFTFLAPIFLSNKHYRYNYRYIRYFSLFCLCISFYSSGYAMELHSNTLSQILFWNLFQYIGLPFMPAFWIIFTLEYNNKETSFRTKFCIFLIPIFTFLFRYTSDYNHLFYFNYQLTTNNFFPVLYIQKGPWYWVHAIFSTICCISANYIYFTVYKKSSGPIRRQNLLMLVASFLPWTSYMLDLLNLSPLVIDYGPFAVTSSVILFFIAFLRYRFLNIKPLARDKVFESTNDGIIVFDVNYNLIDYNYSAQTIFSNLSQNIGKNVEAVFPNDQLLVYSILNSQEFQYNTFFQGKKSNFRVNVVEIFMSKNNEVGYIVTFTNITKYMEMVEKLNYLASRDELTGIFNRRYFVEFSSRELIKAKNLKKALSLIIFDLDFFKRINDNYGHQAGDVVLQEVARICRDSIRSGDILGRFGGEEFVVLFPNTCLEECEVIAEKILKNIESAEIVYEDKVIKITASVGITGVDYVTNESLNCFLKNADRALYQAKSMGRNCFRSVSKSRSDK